MREDAPGAGGAPGLLGDHGWPAAAGGREGALAPAGRQPAVSAATYWRRRVVVLTLGIGLLTLFAWAVNGTLSSGPGPQALISASSSQRMPGTRHPGRAPVRPGGARSGTQASAASNVPGSGGAATEPGRGNRAAGGSGPAAGAGRPRTGPANRGGSGRASRAPGPQGGWRASPAPGGLAGTRGSATPGGGASAAPRASGRAGRPAGSPRGGDRTTAHIPDCGRGEVTLSLFTPRYWYQRGQDPEFAVVAVATGRPCRFNMGARFVSVVVTYAGSQVWSSQDCARGPGSRVTVLTRGRPAVLWAFWNRRTAMPGCQPALSHRARDGTYLATAVGGQFRSRPVVLVLAAPGIAVP
jgi:hypothetical protein